jgi:putative membrane protein
MRFLLRVLVNAAALWVAVRLFHGITFEGGALAFLAVAAVFGVVNAFVGPVLKVLTCPLIALTLGLFTFLINGFLLWLTSALSVALGLGFHVSGFWAAVGGALVVSIVSAILSLLVIDGRPSAERG